MLTMRNSLMLAFCIAMVWSDLTAANAQDRASFQTRARVDEKALVSAIPNPRILAYDLSPDGTRLALFVVSSELVQFPAPSWIVLASAADSKILEKAPFGTIRQPAQGYAPQVAFTADGKLLIVEDEQQTVSVLDAATLATVRTIAPDMGSRFNVPVSIVTAGNSAIVAISFGTGAPVMNYLDKRPTHTVIVDAANGKQIANWDADDIPFSISPNAEFVAVSDHSVAGPVMGVAILDAKSGKKVVTLSGGYPSRIGQYPDWKEQFSTRIIAKFMNDDEVVLTPDANADQSVSDAAASVKVVRITGAHVIQEIDPERYGPIGEIAVSTDQSTFVAVSRYLAPKYRKHPHWRIPSDTRPDFLVFSKQEQQMFRLVNRTKLPELLGLRTRGLFDTAGLRVSRDGSVISVAEDYGVTVLARK
jgi:hypothetical protein